MAGPDKTPNTVIILTGHPSTGKTSVGHALEAKGVYFNSIDRIVHQTGNKNYKNHFQTLSWWAQRIPFNCAIETTGTSPRAAALADEIEAVGKVVYVVRLILKKEDWKERECGREDREPLPEYVLERPFTLEADLEFYTKDLSAEEIAKTLWKQLLSVPVS